MKRFLTLFTVALMTFGLVAIDAEAAKRLGGGQSIGKQRDMSNRDATPQQPAAPSAAPQAPGKAAAAPAAGGSRWLGPLAGLAAGGLLAALFMGGAFEGIKFMDVLLLAALIGGAFMLFRMLRRPAPASAQAAGTSHRIAVPDLQPGAPLGAPGASAASPAPASTGTALRVPPGFQIEPFVRNAKLSFIRLQAANDAKDLADIREYTTPEMYAEISMHIQERGSEPQKTEVQSVDANLLEVVTEGNLAIASVRFNGAISENGGPAERFDEIWHVQKDTSDPKSVWLIAGIQQVA